MIISYLSYRYANSYLVIDKNSNCLLIDTNEKVDEIIKTIKRDNLTLKAILLTHGHYDHMVGINEFLKRIDPELPVYLYKEEVPFLTHQSLNLAKFIDENVPSSYVIEAKNIVKLSEGDKIDILSEAISVIHTPFHTSGSLCYFLEDENALFSGDTLFYSSIGRTDLPTSEPHKIETSLEKLMKLDDEVVVYPGHGKSTTIGREKKYNQFIKEK